MKRNLIALLGCLYLLTACHESVDEPIDELVDVELDINYSLSPNLGKSIGIFGGSFCNIEEIGRAHV